MDVVDPRVRGLRLNQNITKKREERVLCMVVITPTKLTMRDGLYIHWAISRHSVKQGNTSHNDIIYTYIITNNNGLGP